MQEAPIPGNEAQRQDALDRLCVLDTPAEERFERIVRLARSVFHVPIALISLVDRNRQWFKAAVGLEATETSRSVSFCAHAIRAPETFVVEDARLDARFVDNPLVTGEPHIRFYAGRPLRSVDGHLVGTLCLIDREPGRLSASEHGLLDDLAVLAERELNDMRASAQAEALHAERKRLRVVVDAALDGIISVDHRGHIVEFNPAAERIFGYRRADVIGSDMADLVVPEQMREMHRRGVQSYLAGKDSKIIGRRLIINAMRRGGEEFPAELSVSATPDGPRNGFTGHFRDVSERMQIRGEMERLSTQLDTVFKANPDGLLGFGGGGRLQLVNPAFIEMTGLSRHDLFETTAAEFDERFASLCRQPPAGLATLDGDDDALIELLRPRPRTLRRFVRRLAADDAPVASIICFRDVTDEHAADRMKSEFLSTTAHELRTPLASIQGFTELLLQADYDEATRRELLQTVYEQACSLTTLVTELLDLARIEERAGRDFNIRPQAIEPLVERAVHAFRWPGDARSIELDPGGHSTVEVAVDPDKFTQALNNLIGNAFKYSCGRGRLVVRLRRAARDDRRMVGVDVEDQGIGMTEEQQARAFERFYRADATGAIAGTGLGLSLVREIVRLHQGEIELKSAPGVGTTVTIWLPELG
ncbi:PAS domain S-box protein [Sinimarinibacterium flocculans]|uniref:PAS domain S-box protein n=1 Tax=Sinimarinibacterium flocculans TaxID=985250 RepID=UPI0035168A13